MNYIRYGIGLLFVSSIMVSCANDPKKSDSKEKDLPPPKDMFLDAEAETLLDNMTKVVGDLTSCSFTVNSTEKSGSDSLFSPTKQADVYFKGSNKMYVHSVSELGENAFWYDGKHLSYYSYLNDTYDSISAPASTMEMIEKINADYGIKFPAADFFYPSLTDDLIELSDSILYIGDTLVKDNEIAVVKCASENLNIFIFINKSTQLPAGMFINNLENESKFKAALTNWQINPDLDDVLFEFTAPSGSSRSIINRK